MICKARPLIFIFFLIFCSLCCAQPPIKEVCFQNICVQAEIVDTESKRQLGLMFRKSLPENEGMLFIFEQEERYNFWMKNMQVSLDIIWIDKDKRVVDIRINVPPCKDSCEGLTPRGKAQYVLEVNAGFTERNRIKIGDEVSF